MVRLGLLSVFAVALVSLGAIEAAKNQKPFLANGYQNTTDTICTTKADGTQACYPAVFQATNEFQVIMPGQSVPPGLHVQIDMTTGQRKAKLMSLEESANSINDNEHRAVVIVDDNNITPELAHNDEHGQIALSNGKQHSTSHPSSSSLEQYIDHIVAVTNGPADPKAASRMLEILGELEELVHDTRHARQLLHNVDSVPALLRLSDPRPHHPTGASSEPWSPAVRQLSSVVLGSAVQNDQKLQGIALRSGAVTHLLDFLQTETHLKSLGKHVFALSAIVRGHSAALEQFAMRNGFKVLQSIQPSLLVPYHDNNEAEANKLEGRLVRFIDDLFNPEFNPDATPDTSKLLKDGASVWCKALVSRLINNLEDVDDVVEIPASLYQRRLIYAKALQSIRVEHPDSCVHPIEFKSWVQEELVTLLSYNQKDDVEEYRQVLNELDY
ncbi:nucleotide exchange factor sil1 [Coemansia sp. RSA 1813]|nr:nucleotide exchange factor sil1 [Coemansia sp. RSA 1646]KAJ1766776.1 nucleotide exchange factor sil1 [Coemansia sp. RSA 1843]KAJ2091821.1 nucleotide exchange factor sil1 [Coemansia sp. RSA 986]KAJ2215853.1 nucleotide exchange factor sil1 [Coemansia sp. RSA 487]KAJ2571783.1 nucleotide exchange factor sil1 [Coemansia sp. RSA 1813]